MKKLACGQKKKTQTISFSILSQKQRIAFTLSRVIFLNIKIISKVTKLQIMIQKMLFVGFYQIDRKQQTTFQQFYSYLTFVFKVTFLISLGFYINAQITRNGLQFANIPSRTWENKELWRLFTAPFASLEGFYGIISIINAFWWLLSLFPGYERKYSSIHTAIEIFAQNLIFQLLYSLFVLVLLKFHYFQETHNDYFYSLGWVPLIIIWVFIYTGQNLDRSTEFCFLPFKIKNSYLPWIITFMFIVLSIQKTSFIIAGLLGWIQFHVLKASFIKLSVKNHYFIERLFSVCFYCFTSFIKVEQVQSSLSNICKASPSYVPEFEKFGISLEEQICELKAQPSQNEQSSQKLSYEVTKNPNSNLL